LRDDGIVLTVDDDAVELRRRAKASAELEGIRAAQQGRDALVAGDVLAIEPALWDAQVGEVRFEDLVLVTEQGCETLTRFPYDLATSAP
jgi:Xaa-Pro aminopeptidase